MFLDPFSSLRTFPNFHSCLFTDEQTCCLRLCHCVCRHWLAWSVYPCLGGTEMPSWARQCLEGLKPTLAFSISMPPCLPWQPPLVVSCGWQAEAGIESHIGSGREMRKDFRDEASCHHLKNDTAKCMHVSGLSSGLIQRIPSQFNITDFNVAVPNVCFGESRTQLKTTFICFICSSFHYAGERAAEQLWCLMTVSRRMSSSLALDFC